MRNSACLVFVCFTTAPFVVDVAAVAVQALELDSSFSAEVTGSGHMMRSEGAPSPNSHQAPAAHEHTDPSADESDALATHNHNSTSKDAGKKLKIELYYESRCPDCVIFINNSLAPLWRNKELEPHVELTMNPYGNAMTVPLTQISEGYMWWHPEEKKANSGWEFVHICQHGGEECFANTIQACAISKLEKKQSMELILCMESLPEYGIEKSSYECMDKDEDIDKDKIRACAKGPEGNKLLAEFGKKTKAVPGRQGTPWLMINGHHLDNPMHLLQEVCAHVGPGPTSCKSFEHKKAAKHEDEGGDDDEFKVFSKVSDVDKSLVILAPPKNI